MIAKSGFEFGEKVRQNMPLAGSDQLPSVSVIIPSYNSEKSIAACLASLAQQMGAEAYEIILVDSSIDRTPDIVRTHFPQVRYFHLAERTLPGHARNYGIARARGKILALTDSDCVAAANWLQEILKAHESSYQVIGGGIINAFPWHPVSVAEYFLEFREFSAFSRRREIDILPTNNLAVRREIFERFGAFSGMRASEDVVFIHNLRRNGVKVLFEPRIQIRHLNRRAFRPFMRNQEILGFHAALSRRILPLKGAALAQHPYVLPLLPFVRILRTMQFILHNRWPYNLKQLSEFVLTLPFFFLGACAWSWGFYRGTREPESRVASLRAQAESAGRKETSGLSILEND
jgi:glycosyltransferase involved in cell wall biosynthesis